MTKKENDEKVQAEKERKATTLRLIFNKSQGSCFLHFFLFKKNHTQFILLYSFHAANQKVGDQKRKQKEMQQRQKQIHERDEKIEIIKSMNF